MEGFNLFKNKKSKTESALGKISKIAKFATLGTGLAIGASNLEAQEIHKNKNDGIRSKLEKNINIENEKDETVNGGNIEEVTVYSKRKYVDELKKQQEKYLADMAKFEKDSAEWVQANQVYQDDLKNYNKRLKLYNDSLYVYNQGSKFLKDIANASQEYKNLVYEQRKKEGAIKAKDYIELPSRGDNIRRWRKPNDPEGRYHIGIEDFDPDDYPIDDGYLIPNHEMDVTDRFLNDVAKTGIKPTYIKNVPVNRGDPYGLTTFDFPIGLINKPKKPIILPNQSVEPIKPIKENSEKIKYDPKYENLKMRSLWATILKQDPNAKIGTLHSLDPLFEKGFTLDEAITFPQEIKDQYNIDYIYNQIHGKEKQKEDYKHPDWDYNEPTK